MKKDINSLFRKAVDGYEEPYSPQAWEAIKSKIPHSGNSFTTWIVSGIAGATLVVGSIFFFSTGEKPVQKTNVSFTSEEKDVAIVDQKESANTLSQKVGKQAFSAKELPKTHLKNEQKLSSQNITNKGNEKISNVSSSKDLVSISTTSDGQNNQKDIQHNASQSKFVIPTISCSAQSICLGEKVIFKAEHIDKQYPIFWMSSTGEEYSGNSIQISPTNSIDISALATDENGIEHKVGQYHIAVNKIDAPQIQLTEEQKNTKPHFVLQVENQNYAGVHWNLDYQNALGNTFDFYLVKKGTYTVNYTIEGKNKCVSHFTKEVQLENDYNLFAENTFTPSANINNVFLPKALLVRNVDFKLTIFDRSGKIFYTTTDATLPWKGESENGDFAPQGTYLWTVTMINEEGTPEKYAGEILLLR